MGACLAAQVTIRLAKELVVGDDAYGGGEEALGLEFHDVWGLARKEPALAPP
jgi:hypothetical protein